MNKPQKSFAGGEIAPALHSRSDQVKYATGLKTCRNFFVGRHGGVLNRPGTVFIGENETPSETVKLIPFVFNSSQTYVLEFGDQYMRVIQNGAQLTINSQSITNISNANPGVVTYSGADNYANGDVVVITGVVGDIANNINGRYFKVANVSAGANTFELTTLSGTNFNTTSLGTYTSGGTVSEIYKISTPFVEADLLTLQFVQSADSIIIVHPSYAPRELTRSGHTSWTLSTLGFTGDVTVNATGFSSSTGGTGTTFWACTVQSNETGEESAILLECEANAAPTSGAPITVTVTLLGGVPGFGGITAPGFKFNIYKKLNGIYGYIGSCYGVASAPFIDNGITPDITDTPPSARAPFASSDNYPSCVTYYQNRRLFANTNTLPETIYASMTGVYSNFREDQPIQDNFPITWSMVGRQVNTVRHLLELGRLVVLTSAGEWAVYGDGAGILTPTEIDQKQFSANGSSTLKPLVVGDTALYVQDRANKVLDLAFSFSSDGYTGNDLTVFAGHLFEGYTIVDWAYQQIPNSIIWAVRSDGVLLGLTYLKDQEIWAWHRHDFGSDDVERVCVVPEGNEDAVYLVIKRTINGSTVRYIERMETRVIDEDAVEDMIFMDSALTYDGTNAGAVTMTISGGTNWTSGELLTLTASSGTFVSTDVGNRFDLTSATGTVIRFTISSFTSTTVVQGFAHMTVPANLRSTATATWTDCVDQVTGLWHLEGEEVSVLGDGHVVANPNNAAYATTVTVTNGIATLPEPYGVIQIGLPIIADLETLEIDVPEGQSLATKQKLINQVTIHVEKTRGLFVGDRPPTDDDTDPLENLKEIKLRDSSEGYENPVELFTGKADVIINASYNNNGRVFIRQVDPLPASILGIIPTGIVTGDK